MMLHACDRTATGAAAESPACRSRILTGLNRRNATDSRVVQITVSTWRSERFRVGHGPNIWRKLGG